MSSWLLNTAADTTPKPPMTVEQRNRRTRKNRKKRLKNAIIQGRKKGKTIGRVENHFWLKERRRSRN